MMNRAQILDICTVKVHEIKIDGFPENIRLRELSGSQREEYFLRLSSAGRIKVWKDGKQIEIPNPKGLEAYVIAASMIDEKDELMFSEDEVNRLFKGDVSLKLFDKIAEINGLLGKAYEDAKKN